MTWAKVDDQLHGHPKTSEAGVPAMGLWVLALSHCAAYLTDGLVTRRVAVRLAGSEENAEQWAGDLVRAELWSVDPEGWRFHEYLQHQPSAKKVKAERKAAATRKQMSRRDMPVTPRVVTPKSQLGHTTPSRPVPSRPKDTKPSAAGAAGLPGIDPPRAPKAGPVPMPWTIAAHLAELDAASCGRVVISPFDDTFSKPLTATIRSLSASGCTLRDVALAGEWINAGGLGFMTDGVGLAWLAKGGNVSDAIGKARVWDANGRPRVSQPGDRRGQQSQTDPNDRPELEDRN